MIDSQFQALQRWSDTIYGFAVLLTDDRRAANVLTIQLSADLAATPRSSRDAEVYRRLLKHAPHRPRRSGSSVLPHWLAALPADDRLLLAAWLLWDLDGSMLVAVTGSTRLDLATRLAATIRRCVAQLGLTAPSLEDGALMIAISARLQAGASDLRPVPIAWDSTIAEIRSRLAQIIAQEHLSQAGLVTIEAAVHDRQRRSMQSVWRRQAAWLMALFLSATLLLLLIRPWSTAAQTGAVAPINPRTAVARAIAGWTVPRPGLRHQRVWSLDERLSPAAGVWSDLWLDGATARHRVEVWRNETLVEWQIGDGNTSLDYAADPTISACAWGQEPTILSGRAHHYVASSDTQRAARDAWLQQSGYGIGYDLLQRALAASDLRSFGSQKDGPKILLVLGFTDTRAARQIILRLDPQANQLYTAYAINIGRGPVGRLDLWRLVLDESVATIATPPPAWNAGAAPDAPLLDPTCPALDPQSVLSARMLAGASWPWWQLRDLPRALPPTVTRAAILTSTPQDTRTALAPQDVQAIFIGPGRRLNMRALLGRPIFLQAPLPRGAWQIELTQAGDRARVLLCRRPEAQTPCTATLELTAIGWNRADLLAFVDTLAPITADSWLALDAVTLDPAPLPPAAREVIGQTLARARPQSDATLYTQVIETNRIDPRRVEWRDPYHVPLAVLLPEQTIEERWQTIAAGTIRSWRWIRRTPDGTIVSAAVNDGRLQQSYTAADGTIWQRPATIPDSAADQTPASTLLTALFDTPAPITLATRNGMLVLQQTFPPNTAASAPAVDLVPSNVWQGDLGQRTLVRRLWIDQATLQPDRLEIVAADPAGGSSDVALYTIRLAASRYDSAPLAANLALPPLPPDTIVMAERPGVDPLVVNVPLEWRLPDRMLGWQPSATVTIDREQQPPVGDHEERLAPALSDGLYGLDRSELIRVTQYRLAPSGAVVTIRQGARDLLRNALRYHARDLVGANLSWTASTPLSVTIAGKPRQAWLLQSNAAPALVVEVDGVLLHITGPDPAFLSGPLLAELPQLVWQALP